MSGSVAFEDKTIAIDGNFKNCRFNVPIFIDNSIEAELILSYIFLKKGLDPEKAKEILSTRLKDKKILM